MMGQVQYQYLDRATNPHIPSIIIELLKKMLSVKVDSRPFATQALKHKAFSLIDIPGPVPKPKGVPSESSFRKIEDK